jgi:uncharacterized protein
MKQTIIGRELEQAELARCMKSNRSEFVIVYGRRRVGKTFLVDNFFDGMFDFTFVGGHNLTKAKQLRSFAKALKKSAGMTHQPILSDWTDAFDALEDYLENLPKNRKKVIFIDEMPWIDTPKSEFVEALEGFWNGWGARRNDIVFIASGSASSWMMDKLVENPGGLHARITCNIYVRPFTLKETKEYLLSRDIRVDEYQVTQLYMILGGIPFYLSLLNPAESILANIDRLFFRKNGELKTEFDELYNAIFSKSEKYLEVVELLNKNREGLTYNQIKEAVKLDGKRLTTVIKNLERCDFIVSYIQFGFKNKGTIYRLVDFYTLFYYKFVDRMDSKDEQWWTNNYDSRSVQSWQGVAFELVCLTHLTQIKQALGISGISTSASTWRYVGSKDNQKDKGAQIDLVIDRGDHTINLCEMKFSTTPYVISAEYEQHVRDRIALFREKTKTTKSLVSTFVTTFGVARGIHRSIVQKEITAKDLVV